MTFGLLARTVDFEPGQYFFVTLPDVGHQDERGLRRHITVVTSPNERDILGLWHPAARHGVQAHALRASGRSGGRGGGAEG